MYRLRRNLVKLIVCVGAVLLSVPIATLQAGNSVLLPSVTGDNMVLQQQANVPIWGWAEPNEKVVVAGSWDGRETTAAVSADGRWKVLLATPKAGGPYTITVKGGDEITLKNILIGEVWVCSGQSNMQFTLGKGQRWYTGDINEETEVPVANYPDIRFFTVRPKYNPVPQDDCNGVWVQCSPETVKTFSAVGYYFGREIHKKLNVPVGLICAAYGGTMAEAWTSREGLASESEFAEMLAAYDKDKAAYPELRAEYDKKQDAWNAAKSKATAEGKEYSEPQPKKPARVPNQNSPTVLWNAMVHPIVPFAVRGVIWYQGESNDLDKRSWQYTRLFPLMIRSWRTEWQQGEFPFYFVQIAPYKDMSPEIREAQRLAERRVANTGMVVTTDVGDCSDIHPRNKRPVGERLAKWALTKTYGTKDIAFSGPMYKRIEGIKGSSLAISFDHADDGLEVRGGQLTGFTIAGADRKFVPAKAEIDGSRVIVWSDEVKEPVAVRFGWANCPEATLFNKAGLPASPFKTDDWKWETDTQ